MSSSRMSLADQLKALQDPTPTTQDPEDAYSSLDTLQINRQGDEGREHYLDVGSSKMKNQQVSQTLLTDKYGGKKVGRVKIFEDDEESEDGEELDGGDGSGSGEEDDEDQEEEDEDEDEDEDDEDEGDEDEEEEDEEEEEAHSPRGESSKSLDPLSHLHASRAKDIEKGQAIRRQQRLFENTLTLRITFQKAVTASQKIPKARDQEDEQVQMKRVEALAGLAELSERLFALRSGLLLPGTEEPSSKRRKLSSDASESKDESYWKAVTQDSLRMVDASHANVSAILSKWSAKIHAATVSGKSKFSASEGPTSVLDAIESGLAGKREADRSFIDSEEAGYRALLREVIESRSGQSSAVDLTHLRKEKKKKREAERGGSKGRKLRYTVHEKAQSFMVPIPLSEAWHDEQVDELFASLFGGAKVAVAADEQHDKGLDGLRMLG